jgi:hypothetical protein
VNFLSSYQYLLLVHFQYRCFLVLFVQIYGASQEGFVFI